MSTTELLIELFLILLPIIFVLIIFSLIIGVCIYLFYVDFIKKDKHNEADTNNNETNKSVAGPFYPDVNYTYSDSSDNKDDDWFDWAPLSYRLSEWSLSDFHI